MALVWVQVTGTKAKVKLDVPCFCHQIHGLNLTQLQVMLLEGKLLTCIIMSW